MIEDHLVHSGFWTHLIYNYTVITTVHMLIMLCYVRYYSAKILVGFVFSSSQDNRGERTVDLGLLP